MTKWWFRNLEDCKHTTHFNSPRWRPQQKRTKRACVTSDILCNQALFFVLFGSHPWWSQNYVNFRVIKMRNTFFQRWTASNIILKDQLFLCPVDGFIYVHLATPVGHKLQLWPNAMIPADMYTFDLKVDRERIRTGLCYWSALSDII